ncbi:TIGR04086 family membrane protein [Heyndrickxia sp. NPDC080065]|uniref:TIGR04086 family membrane protein n=1 Tax=Heyndrickxia sp. NPDC080065 TaxID=3390568 RepID=UPI003CFD9333
MLTIFVFISISSFIFSLILRYTDTQESSIRTLITIISFIALFTGGFICGGKGQQKGWVSGSITGIVYTFIIFLFQYLGYGNIFSSEQMIYHICYILTAMMGGVLGVNIMSDQPRKV